MSKRPSVYVPIEIKNRELNSQVLLGALAAEKGFNVYIGTHHTIHQVIRNKEEKAGLFLDKGGLSNAWQSIKERTNFLGVLDQELSPILIDAGKIQDLLPMRYLNGNENIVDLVYVVGENYFKEARKFHNPKVAIINSGWPRIDLWRAPFSGSYSKSASAIYQKHGHFLLFSSDFGVTSDLQLKTQLDLITSKKAPQHEKNYYLESNSRNSLSDFKRTIEILREWDNNPDIPKIIVRPHPADSFRGWKKSLRGLKKTRVIHEGDINPWVEASRGVIHRGCTTALHGYMLGKPVYFLEGCGDSRKSELPYLISTPIQREYKFNLSETENDVSRNVGTDIVSKAIKLGDVSASSTIIDTWSQLKIKPEEEVSPLLYFIRSITLRSLRRRVGLIKWELLWVMNATPYEPPSQALKGGIKRKDFDVILRFLNKKITLKRIGKDLWLLAPGS